MANHGTASLGQFAEIITAIVRALATVVANLDPKQLIRALQQRGEQLERILEEALTEFLAEVSYLVTVSYDLPLADMIKAGKYDWVNSDIIVDHFPVKGTGTTEVKLVLVHLNRVVSTEEVLRELDARGLQPARIEELLALGAQRPELQLDFPIGGLGSVWLDQHCNRHVPDLSRDGAGRRGLSLCWCGSGWHKDYRFAAVRKDQ